jgi:hypothetical protein
LPGQIIGRQHDGKQTHQVHLDGAKVETLGCPASCTTSNRTLPTRRNAEFFSASSAPKPHNRPVILRWKAAPFRHADEALSWLPRVTSLPPPRHTRNSPAYVSFSPTSSSVYRICLRPPSILVRIHSHDSSSLGHKETGSSFATPTRNPPKRACDGLWSRFDQTATTCNPNEVGCITVVSP